MRPQVVRDSSKHDESIERYSCNCVGSTKCRINPWSTNNVNNLSGDGLVNNKHDNLTNRWRYVEIQQTTLRVFGRMQNWGCAKKHVITSLLFSLMVSLKGGTRMDNSDLGNRKF